MRKNAIFLLVLLSFLSWNCESEKPIKKDRIVIGVPSDAETLNPLFAMNMLEGQIRELLYMGLVMHSWDESSSDIKSSPLLAEKWEWNSDSTSLTFYLRQDALWSDGRKVTAEDVVHSFDLYSDPEVNSGFYGSFDNLFSDKDQHIDMEKTFEIISPTKIKINFKQGAKANLIDIDMPILPKHILSKIPRADLSTINFESNIVTNGPYTISSWKKNETIILKAVNNSFLYNEEMVKQLIYKIVPDENSRITQLKKGEVDLLEDIDFQSIAELRQNPNIKIVARTGRDYDYIGWNHLEPGEFTKNSVKKPNRFFSSATVRKALSHAVNRNEILKEYLQGFGKLSFGPVSPIFSNYYNAEIIPYEYSPAKAISLLESEGWTDTDKDGILEKGSEEFAFKLYMGAGNPRRTFTATVIKNNLRAVGIDVTIETMETGTFINKLFEHEFDAWMAGWTIPLPLDIQPYWHSDFNKSPFNLSSFSNAEADAILERLESERNAESKKELYKKVQQILHDNEPVTFLYWLDVKTAYNSRLEKITIDPLGAVQHCWEWRVKND